MDLAISKASAHILGAVEPILGAVMGYLARGLRWSDGSLCQHDGLTGQFRGPACDLDRSRLAYLGGCDGYGEFLADPLPDLASRDLGLPCANYAQPGAGVDFLLSNPDLLSRAGGARAVILQVSGAHQLSNRYFSVHPRRNDRFTGPSRALRNLFPRVDFFEIHFTRHLMRVLERANSNAFAVVVEELRAVWTQKMGQILDQIEAPVLLLWFADHAPGDSHGHAPRAPLFITPGMLDVFSKRVSRLDVVVSPQALTQDALLAPEGPGGCVRARHLLGPAAHAEAAAQVVPALSRLLEGPEGIKKGPAQADPLPMAV